jgi:glycerol-3-phosphate dehydrogenase
MNQNSDYDILIIGAGVTGCSIARELSFFDVKTAVIEKTSYVCSGQSKSNGAIIHGGHNSIPGTLKAELNVKGNSLFAPLCRELGVKFKNTGILVIAMNPEENLTLNKLLKQGQLNGIKDLRIIDGEELQKIEPNISTNAVSALLVPSGGIVDVHKFVIALAEFAASNGVEFIFENKVKDLIMDNQKVIGVKTGRGDYYSKIVINCAGIDSDEIMNMAGLADIKILPRKGEYYITDKSNCGIVNRPCFQLPTRYSKGVVVFPTINGNIIFGGNSELIESKTDTTTTEDGYAEVLEKSCIFIPKIKDSDVIAQFAGVRSTTENEDFFINKPDAVEGLINVAGIDSPGLSSAPAIAQFVTDIINKSFFKLEKKRNPVSRHKLKPLFRELDFNEKNDLIKSDCRYGRIICRCEEITEGDVIDAIKAPIPARTIDAIKFRTLAGTGRCQGAFDLERILKLVAEYGLQDILKICKNDEGSNIISGFTRS